MKKIFYFVVLLQCAVLAQAQRVPQFVKDAHKNAPEDALVGVGIAKMQTLGMSKTIAATRARAEISRQLSTIIKDMIRDYFRASEADPSAVESFQENITVALSQSRLQRARVIGEDIDTSGNYWVVIMLRQSDIGQELSSPIENAKRGSGDPAIQSCNLPTGSITPQKPSEPTVNDGTT
jgi:hypothetical protein